MLAARLATQEATKPPLSWPNASRRDIRALAGRASAQLSRPFRPRPHPSTSGASQRRHAQPDRTRQRLSPRDGHPPLMQVPVRSGRGGMPETAHQILSRRAGSRGQSLAGMTQIMEPVARQPRLAASTAERLAHSIIPHRPTIVADEHPEPTPGRAEVACADHLTLCNQSIVIRRDCVRCAETASKLADTQTFSGRLPTPPLLAMVRAWVASLPCSPGPPLSGGTRLP